MTREMKVRKGAEYLPEYTIGDLEQMRRRLFREKPRLRVRAAILRKRGRAAMT